MSSAGLAADGPGIDAEVHVDTGRSAGGSGRRRVLVRVHGTLAAVTEAGAAAPDPLDDARRAAQSTAPDLWFRLAAPPDLAAVAAGREPPPDLRHPLDPVPLDPPPGLLDVVVCTNRPPAAVAPLLAQLAGARPLVVENGRPRPALAALAGAHDARHVHTPRPGLAAARNLAMRASTAAWLLFLDDDCRVDDRGTDALLRLVAGAATSRAELGAVTGLVLPDRLDTTAQQTYERVGSHSRSFLPVLYDRGWSPDPRWPLIGCDWMGVGACLALRREAWADVGGFDERLGTGTPARSGEDDALFRSLVEHGWSVLYTPSVTVRHVHRGDARALRRQLRGYAVGTSAHLLLVAADRRSPSLLRAWLRQFREMRRAAAGWPTRLRLAYLLGFLGGPVAAIRSARRRRRQRASG